MLLIKVCLLFVIRLHIASSLLFNKSSPKTFFMSLLVITTTPYPGFFVQDGGVTFYLQYLNEIELFLLFVS